MSDTDPQRALARFADNLGRVRGEISKLIVGQRDVLDGVLTCLLGNGHALLEGVPGLGKTALVRALAASLDLSFSRIQFTPDLMPADIIGTSLIRDDARGGKAFEFERGPLFAHVVLADEINRATPKTQSALLEAMQEHSITVSKQTHVLDEPFLVLATQNPIEMEGTYPLPEAQLDRFLLKLQVGFPPREDIHAILERTTGAAEPTVQKVLDRAAVLEMRATVRNVAVARHVQDYAVRVLEATHAEHARAPERVKRYVRFGSSPRGAQACLIAAKVRALFSGRMHAAIEDVRACVKPALRHRLILNFEGEAEGVTADALLDDILTRIPEQS